MQCLFSLMPLVLIIISFLCTQPENFLCTRRKSKDVQIIDFGLAQTVDPERSVRVLFGSAEFSAPEIISYEPVSFASDMWSLGVCAFMM